MGPTTHWPSIDVDDKGNTYIVWTEDGKGSRHGGVWYSYSKTAGRTWAKPISLDASRDGTDIWPWLAVGDPGRVAVAWLETNRKLPGNNAENAAPNDPWRIKAAQTVNGLGCDTCGRPGFRTTLATPKAVKRGTICTGGTVCQAELIDRRMGDYFTVEIDGTGRMYAGYSDVRQGGAVALPGFVQQTGGPRFLR